MRSVEFHPEAQAELISAARFFEGNTVGLGVKFIRTIQRASQGIPAFQPTSSAYVSGVRA